MSRKVDVAVTAHILLVVFSVNAGTDVVISDDMYVPVKLPLVKDIIE